MPWYVQHSLFVGIGVDVRWFLKADNMDIAVWEIGFVYVVIGSEVRVYCSI